MTESIRCWFETDTLPLTPFSDFDYREFNMAPDQSERGVQAKDFVRDAAGDPWVIKSGALGQIHPPNLSDEEEQSRRAAFSLHEAVMSLLLRRCEVPVNEVGLGFRTMHIQTPAERTRQLVSVHRMRHAIRRDKATALGFNPTVKFVEDLLTMFCIDAIVGQIDHHVLHNYMVTNDGELFVVDNGACMRAAWLRGDGDHPDFEGFASREGDIGWTPTRRARVVERLRALTSEAVDEMFSALPQFAIDWHDARLTHGYYAAGTVAEKQARVKANLRSFWDWTVL